MFIQFVARIFVFSSSRLEAGSDLCIEASQCSCLLNLDVSWFQLPDGIFPVAVGAIKLFLQWFTQKAALAALRLKSIALLIRLPQLQG